MKKSLVLGSAAAIALAVALPASAQGVSFSFGATLTSNYISRGITQTANGIAFQPWVEADFGGFYAGIWGSNVNTGGDTIEIDLYGGYRWSVGNTSMDIGYARYFYVTSGDAGGEIYLLAEHDAGGATLFGGVYASFPGAVALTDVHIGGSFGLFDRTSASVRVGRAPGNTYGDAGITYAVTDNIEVDGRVHFSQVEGTRFVVSASVGW